MRNFQKRMLLEFVQTLQEAHGEIQKLIDQKDIEQAQGLLAQCQESAIQLGDLIEEAEGEGFVTIGYLERYCETLYQVYESLQQEQYGSGNKVGKLLRNQSLKIESSIKNDIHIRKEVVFFPYNASMWDSLESIYLAAKEDPDCDAYCVPIPYFDKNPDGSLGQMHYEGRNYPKNIEVIDWQTYHLEERRPDVIYIHNPYDDCNYVTCVHPTYFSGNLKKYTDKLVYIPYFMLKEVDPDNQEAVDHMKHFCFQPGIINADFVVVQSEAMRRIYIKEYMKAARAEGMHVVREELEKKFLGLGSPKLDKVLNTKKEDLEIPEEWLRIMQKPDGSWKKIIFYNTSISALLHNNEKMLEKMRYVFGIFRENQEEAVLLWRPHPLIPNTLKSMREELWIEYEKLVNDYKQEGWGIYDDSADVDRAMILSDGYYGDRSSLMPLYEKMGKPVVIQQVDILE